MSSELPPDEPEAQPTVTDDSSSRSSRRARRPSRPNYTIRRLLSAGVVAAVVVIAATVIVIVARDQGDTSDSSRPGWNAIAVVERATGNIRIVDLDGDQSSRIEGAGRANVVHAHRDRLALVGVDAISLVGIDGGSPTEIEIDRGWTVERVPSHRSLTFVAAPPSTGNLVVVDGSTAELIDVAEAAGQTSPLLFADSIRTAPNGRAFAIGDGRLFQTVVVRFGDEEATFFPGLPMAVDDELVVTSSNVGSSAELGLFSADGERLGAVNTDRPVGGVIDDDRFVYVTERGDVLAGTTGSSSPVELGTIPVQRGDEVRWVAPAFDHQRMVVAGSRFLAVIDIDGEIVFQTTFTASRELLRPWATWRCLPVGGDDVFQSLVDIETGEVVADLTGLEVADVSADGCAVLAVGEEGRSIMSERGLTIVDRSIRTVHLAPDGGSAVLITTAGAARLVTFADDTSGPETTDGDPAVGDDAVDLGEIRGLVAFVDR